MLPSAGSNPSVYASLERESEIYSTTGKSKSAVDIGDKPINLILSAIYVMKNPFVHREFAASLQN